MPEADTPEQLYWRLLERWNARDASAFAALFEEGGHTIGFDGSEMHGRGEIERGLGEIFADHETASYVAKIREVRLIGDELALVRAVAGMVPAGQRDVNPTSTRSRSCSRRAQNPSGASCSSRTHRRNITAARRPRRHSPPSSARWGRTDPESTHGVRSPSG